MASNSSIAPILQEGRSNALRIKWLFAASSMAKQLASVLICLVLTKMFRENSLQRNAVHRQNTSGIGHIQE